MAAAMARVVAAHKQGWRGGDLPAGKGEEALVLWRDPTMARTKGRGERWRPGLACPPASSEAPLGL